MKKVLCLILALLVGGCASNGQPGIKLQGASVGAILLNANTETVTPYGSQTTTIEKIAPVFLLNFVWVE